MLDTVNKSSNIKISALVIPSLVAITIATNYFVLIVVYRTIYNLIF